jgi:centromeric protein E
VRIRPVKHEVNTLEVESNQKLILTNPAVTKKNPARHKFHFDNIFGANASQKEIYERCMPGYISCVLGGKNATIFAYGVTGTGKTFTMNGPLKDPASGLISQAITHLFNEIEAESAESKSAISYSVIMSYF